MVLSACLVFSGGEGLRACGEKTDEEETALVIGPVRVGRSCAGGCGGDPFNGLHRPARPRTVLQGCVWLQEEMRRPLRREMQDALQEPLRESQVSSGLYQTLLCKGQSGEDVGRRSGIRLNHRADRRRFPEAGLLQELQEAVRCEGHKGRQLRTALHQALLCQGCQDRRRHLIQRSRRE